MSKSGLFAHVGSKEALQEEVLRKAMEQFVQAVVEPAQFDSQPGPVRDVVASTQRQWVEVLAQAVEQPLGDDFRRDLDPERFGLELYGIYLTHHLYRQLLEERRAELWAQTSFEELIERARRPREPQLK